MGGRATDLGVEEQRVALDERGERGERGARLREARARLCVLAREPDRRARVERRSDVRGVAQLRHRALLVPGLAGPSRGGGAASARTRAAAARAWGRGPEHEARNRAAGSARACKRWKTSAPVRRALTSSGGPPRSSAPRSARGCAGTIRSDAVSPGKAPGRCTRAARRGEYLAGPRVA